MGDSKALKSCPFCGGSVSIVPLIGDWYDEDGEIDGDSYEWTIRHNDFHSKCYLRHFSVSGVYRTLDCEEADEQKQRLIEAWNTRHRETCNTLYAVDTWDDLDDYGVSYIERKLYRTREQAEARAEECRKVDGNMRYYARVVEFEVVDA